MIAEKGLDLKLGYVLTKIDEYSSVYSYYRIIKYKINLTPLNYEHLTPQDEHDILNILSKNNLIRIINRQININLQIIIELEIIQPGFNTLLHTFNSLNNKIVLKLDSKKKNKESCFSKYYLIHEINNFEIILKYLLKSELLKPKNYKYIITILNSLSTFIEDVLEINYSDWIKDNIGIEYKQTYLGEDSSYKSVSNVSLTQGSLFRQTPIPITGEIKVTGLDEGLKALSVKTNEDNKFKFPFKIPAGTQWHNVIIKFLDDERIEIHVKRLKHITNYKEMGMLGKGKIPTPNEQWYLLKVLAKCYGEISIRDPEAKDKYKKQKQELTETLRNYFSIDYDPFYPYQSSPEKPGNSYKIKIFLIPPPQKDNINDSDKDNDPLGIQEYLQENSFR